MECLLTPGLCLLQGYGTQGKPEVSSLAAASHAIMRIDTTGREVLGTPGPTTESRGSSFLHPDRDCGALHLQILRCSTPINITVRCTYKYYGALHLQILRCAAPTNITVRCTYKYHGALHYKYHGALHLQILRCSAPTNIGVRCTYKYWGALHLQILGCAAPTNIGVRCTYQYCGALHLQILRCAAPLSGRAALSL